MTKNVVAKEWSWDPNAIGTGGTFNSWEPLGIIIQALAGYIGVLDPLWGIGEIAPARPADWSSEVPGYYYIQPEHAGSSDSNDYGTPTAPRNSIPFPIPAGSRVEVAGGSHIAIGSLFKINGEGTKNSKVWVVGDPSNRPVFTDYSFHIYGSYTYVEGVDMIQTANGYNIMQFASMTPDVGRDTDHCMARDIDITGWLGGGNGVAVASASSTEYVNGVIIDNVRVHNLNDITNPLDEDAHCFSITDWCQNVWVLNCEGHTASGSAVQVGNTSINRRHAVNIFVAKNNFYDVRQSGVWVKNGSRVVFSQNDITNVINTGWSPSKAMGGQYYVEGVWYLFNNIYDCRYGLKVASKTSGAITEYYAIGNKMWNIGQGYDTLSATSGDWEVFGDTNAISLTHAVIAYIIDNTIYSTISGINMTSATDNDISLVISGNIIHEIVSADGYHFQADNTTQNGAVLTNNQYYDSDNIVMINTVATYTTLAAWQSATSNSVGDQYGDPLFTSPGITATEDFTLQAGSPCIDSSAKSSAYATFETEFGFSITVDNEDNARPSVSSDYDRGALEKVV